MEQKPFVRFQNFLVLNRTQLNLDFETRASEIHVELREISRTKERQIFDYFLLVNLRYFSKCITTINAENEYNVPVA